MTSDLLPCPFCGEKAELAIEHDHSWIRHDGCPADIGGFVKADEAVEAWNRRAALADERDGGEQP